MRILVAETSWPTAAVSAELMCQNIGVMRASDGDELLFMAEMAHLNGIVFDARMQGLAAASAVRQLRQFDPNAGILVIGRADARDEAVRLLELGADDVVTEMTTPTEIAARVKAIVRRRAGRASPRIEVGPMTLDIDTQTAEIGGEEMRLTRLEYQLLEFLALGVNTVRTKAAILTQLYLLEDEPHSRVIDAYVCRIRREMTRLGADASVLETVWGRGYMLRDAAKVQAAA
jgi:two-component system, cell cycle response regulator CtrA